MIACTNSEFQTFSFLGSQDTLDTRPVAIFSQIFECVFIVLIFMQRLLFKTFSFTWHVVKKLHLKIWEIRLYSQSGGEALSTCAQYWKRGDAVICQRCGALPETDDPCCAYHEEGEKEHTTTHIWKQSVLFHCGSRSVSRGEWKADSCRLFTCDIQFWNI